MQDPARSVEPPSVSILSHGMLGYGFPLASLEEAERRGFALLAIDAGSTDPGPYYLGSGRPFVSETMVKRDLDFLLPAARRQKAKVVIGSAGGAGTAGQLEFVASILRKVVAEQGLGPLKLGLIDTELSKPTLKNALSEGRIRRFETRRDLTDADIEEATHVVAQIGIEPMVAALADGCDILLCGRAWDVANVAAYPVLLGHDRGLSFHLGKILECGGQAAVPVEGSDLLMGRLEGTSFIVETPHARKACTVESVGAHTLYEKSNPVWLPGPGGTVDLKETCFEPLGTDRVTVTGSRFHPAPRHTVKLEGARLAGYRHIAIAGIRDPLMIRQLDAVAEGVRSRLVANLGSTVAMDSFDLRFRFYGRDGVMGPLEPTPMPGHEIGLVIDVVAKTAELAETVCAMARSLTLHWAYPGRIATAGNLAFPFSPADLPAGPVYEFNIYHLMEIDDPAAAFPFTTEVLP
ncbi:MAG: acyclic terpene utilization AtuA family protein [Methylobacterium sp.]|nr:acyclic terpene utilization AtuA family protein [Methylobacterium sp.]MCA3639797.1 acyclic terpene utilization AtuA family protein [Methylobacterium sp.]MCA3642786.1 acyclic terpene utilization AtuA family protein [Methylobacterium sp.]MCA3647427.1 acyclic terpene utilization AtuA family protein [Methylobacterium sp.]MCA3653611.1 acyclic terpene utilization AtuA family protein [Methylobacterium sp.]